MLTANIPKSNFVVIGVVGGIGTIILSLAIVVYLWIFRGRPMNDPLIPIPIPMTRTRRHHGTPRVPAPNHHPGSGV